MESDLFNNLFEVELKEHYENLFAFRDEEIELVNDIKLYTKPRAGTPTNRNPSNYFFSEKVSIKTTLTHRQRGERARAKSEYERKI